MPRTTYQRSPSALAEEDAPTIAANADAWRPSPRGGTRRLVEAEALMAYGRSTGCANRSAGARHTPCEGAASSSTFASSASLMGNLITDGTYALALAELAV